MYERGYVKGTQKKAFLNYLVKMKYFNKSEVTPINKEERVVVKKAGLEDALFFRTYYLDKTWQIDYIRKIAKKFKVSVYVYDDFGDKRTHNKIA